MSKYNRKKLQKHPSSKSFSQQIYGLIKVPKLDTILKLAVTKSPFYGKKTVQVHYKGHPEKDHLACHVKTDRQVNSPSPYNPPSLLPQDSPVSAKISYAKNKAKSKANGIIHGGSRGLISNY